VSRHQKGKTKTNLDLFEQETVSGNGIGCICTSPQTSQMPFLPPNQQHQSTEGKTLDKVTTREMVKMHKVNSEHFCAITKATD